MSKKGKIEGMSRGNPSREKHNKKPGHDGPTLWTSQSKPQACDVLVTDVQRPEEGREVRRTGTMSSCAQAQGSMLYCCGRIPSLGAARET